MNKRMRKPRKEETVLPFPAFQDDTMQFSSTAPQHTVNEVQPIVQEVLSSSGQPLDTDTQMFMESRFGHDFSQVRVHTDERAVESAQEVNALAYTVGKDVVFGAGQYSPETNKGQELIAHELTHVVQQDKAIHSQQPQIPLSPNSFEHEAQAMAKILLSEDHSTIHMMSTGYQVLQKQNVPGGGATPGTGKGIDIIFIMRAPADAFTSDVTRYVRTVLEGQETVEVDNLDDIFARLSRQRSPVNVKVRRIRIVAHGSTTGGMRMTPRGEQARRWVKPQEVEAYARRADIKALIKDVMAADAVVEFWGCNLGNVPEASKTWSSAFQSTFKAPTGTFRTRSYSFVRRAEAGEKGEQIPGRPGHWIRVTRTSEVDSRNKALQVDFRRQLLLWYGELAQNGDIAPVEGEDRQIAFMRDLFDRSQGDIKFIVVDRAPGQYVRPGDQENWRGLWKQFNPINIGEQAK